jgi:hypothetical protein
LQSEAILSPIAKDEVAAGEGALQTLMTFFVFKIKKSSDKLPLLSQA